MTAGPTAEQGREALELKREHLWIWKDIAAAVGWHGGPGSLLLAAAIAGRVPLSRHMLNRLDPEIRAEAVRWNRRIRRQGSLEPSAELEAPGFPREPRQRVPMVVTVPTP